MGKGAKFRFGAGALAGLLAVVPMLAARLSFGVPTALELAAEWFVGILPAEVFSLLLDTLQGYSKPLLLVLLLLLQLLGAGAVGAGLITRGAAGQPQSLTLVKATLFSVCLWLFTMVAFYPLFGQGVFGASGPYPWRVAAAAQLFSSLSYGLGLWWITRLFAFASAKNLVSEPEDFARRQLIFRTGLGLFSLAAAGSLAGLLVQLARVSTITSSQPRLGPFGGGRNVDGMPPEVTPNKDFYVVSKNLIDPQVKAAEWTLEVVGMVDRPYSLPYEELKSLPSHEEMVTLECISNPLGGDLMSNALWRGVRVKDLLDRAGGPHQGAVDLALYAVEGYSDSITVEKGLHPDTIVAYEMNGEPLSYKHGFPARLVVPGIYGMKNVKWLTKIEVVDKDFLGFWEKQGWSDAAVVKTTSRIDRPGRGEQSVERGSPVAGVAFAGDRGIAKVEVSLDGGKSWGKAQLKEPLSPYTWVFWSYDWTPPNPGVYAIMVRATDKKGKIQDAVRSISFPDGASGLHSIEIKLF